MSAGPGDALILRPAPSMPQFARAPGPTIWARRLLALNPTMKSLTFFENLKLYVGFTDESSAALRRFHPAAQPFFAPIIDDFYAAIEAHPGAQRGHHRRPGADRAAQADAAPLAGQDAARPARRGLLRAAGRASAACTSASSCRRRTCSRPWTGSASSCSTSCATSSAAIPTGSHGDRDRAQSDHGPRARDHARDLPGGSGRRRTATPSGSPPSASSPPASGTSCATRSASSSRRSISSASTSATGGRGRPSVAQAPRSHRRRGQARQQDHPRPARSGPQPSAAPAAHRAARAASRPPRRRRCSRRRSRSRRRIRRRC